MLHTVTASKNINVFEHMKIKVDGQGGSSPPSEQNALMQTIDPYRQ